MAIRCASCLPSNLRFCPGRGRSLSALSSSSFTNRVRTRYGGALSYTCEHRNKAAAELVRVVRSGGTLLTSVMSLFGATVDLVRRPYIQLLKDPDEEEVWRVIEDGDLLGFPSSEVEMQHPPMHLFSSDELRTLLPGCEVEELVGSNVTTFEGSTTIDQVAADQDAWSTSVKLERRLNSVPGLVDSGSHIIMAARKQKR